MPFRREGVGRLVNSNSLCIDPTRVWVLLPLASGEVTPGCRLVALYPYHLIRCPQMVLHLSLLLDPPPDLPLSILDCHDLENKGPLVDDVLSLCLYENKVVRNARKTKHIDV